MARKKLSAEILPKSKTRVEGRLKSVAKITPKRQLNLRNRNFEKHCRRRSSRIPKPLLRKNLNLSDILSGFDSEGELMDRFYNDDNTKEATSSTKTVQVKRFAPKREPIKQKNHFSNDKDDDVTFEKTKKAAEETPKRKYGVRISIRSGDKNKGEKSGGDGGGSSADQKRDEERDYIYNYMDFDDNGEKDQVWVKPNYKDKNWFKDNCFRCQFCNKKYGHTTDALQCFHNHKNLRRCYICFFVMGGGKDGDKRMYKHYQKRHSCGIPHTIQCPYCDEFIEYKAVPDHVISTHFLEAMLELKQTKQVVQNVEKAKPVIPNVEKAKPVIPNVEKAKPIVQNVEKAKPIVQNVEKVNPVVQSVEKAKPVVQNVEKVKQVIQNQVKPIIQTGESVKPVVQKNKSKKKELRFHEGQMVERVLRKNKIPGGCDIYFVKWVGLDKSQNTWVPKNQLEDYMDLVVDYENRSETRRRRTALRKIKMAEAKLIGNQVEQPVCQQPLPLSQQQVGENTANFNSSIIRKDKLKKIDEREYKILGIDT